MTHITVSLPDAVASEYVQASQQLNAYLAEAGPAPDAATLMRFMLASFKAEDIGRHFDACLRNLTGQPVPDEPESWVFPRQFDDAP